MSNVRSLARNIRKTYFVHLITAFVLAHEFDERKWWRLVEVWNYWVTSAFFFCSHWFHVIFYSADEYCVEPMPVRDGFFMCKPSQCDSFRVGTELHYLCNKNYKLSSTDHSIRPFVLTCQPGGHWSHEQPVCLPGKWSSVIVLKVLLNTTFGFGLLISRKFVSIERW